MKFESSVLLSLGSNLGDRRKNLQLGLQSLIESGLDVSRVSPVVESAAILPKGSPADWNQPYLNFNVHGSTRLDLETVHRAAKLIQGRMDGVYEHSSQPRKIDIDIVNWDGDPVRVGGKTIPDIQAYRQPFVLSPLVHTYPHYQFSSSTPSAFELSFALAHHIPLWMGIVNITPDSFSDGGTHFSTDAMISAVQDMVRSGVHIIDVGAESTRPNAMPLTAAQEWDRLHNAITGVMQILQDTPLPPRLSVDTYHPENAEKALSLGVDMINDVTGLTNETMMALARESGKEFVAMHSVTVPVDLSRSLDPSADAVDVFEKWVRAQRLRWSDFGIDLGRIIIDPGIGFGKTGVQSLSLMSAIPQLRNLGHRVLVGHSRKRCLKGFAKRDSGRLDIETVGASLNMCAQKVDILRIHDVASHARAYLSWVHLQSGLHDFGESAQAESADRRLPIIETS